MPNNTELKALIRTALDALEDAEEGRMTHNEFVLIMQHVNATAAEVGCPTTKIGTTISVPTNKRSY